MAEAPVKPNFLDLNAFQDEHGALNSMRVAMLGTAV